MKTSKNLKLREARRFPCPIRASSVTVNTIDEYFSIRMNPFDQDGRTRRNACGRLIPSGQHLPGRDGQDRAAEVLRLVDRRVEAKGQDPADERREAERLIPFPASNRGEQAIRPSRVGFADERPAGADARDG